MRQHQQRDGQKTQPMSAGTVTADARWMLEQLSLPVDPRDTIKARRERAIRRAGLSPAKGMRIWYRQTCDIMAHEYLTLVEAYKNHVRKQERLLADELEQLRVMREARELREKQIGLDLETPSRALAAMENAASNGGPIAHGKGVAA